MITLNVFAIFDQINDETDFDKESVFIKRIEEKYSLIQKQARSMKIEKL